MARATRPRHHGFGARFIGYGVFALPASAAALALPSAALAAIPTLTFVLLPGHLTGMSGYDDLADATCPRFQAATSDPEW
jgi:hypothetical protein